MGKDQVGFGTWAALLSLAFTSSVLAAVFGKLLERSSAHVERVREGYAEATKALVAWVQFPYRIERRVDDAPATRASLAQTGSDMQESLAYYSGWVSAENPVIGEFYSDLLARLRMDVGRHASWAWQQSPRTTAAEMNVRPGELPNPRPLGWAYVQAFSAGFAYRFGWRRYLIPSPILRRRLVSRGLWAPEPRSNQIPSQQATTPPPLRSNVEGQGTISKID